MLKVAKAFFAIFLPDSDILEYSFNFAEFIFPLNSSFQILTFL
jgi:hypothetical protein